MNDSRVPIYVKVSPESHTKFKTYVALSQNTMQEVMEELIETLTFD
jgi:hypothetical protein